MSARVSPEMHARILRCVPDAGSGEVVSIHEVAERLGLSSSAVTKVLRAGVLKGVVEKVRKGRYVLAKGEP